MRAPELSWLTRRGSDPLKVIASVLPRRSQVRLLRHRWCRRLGQPIKHFQASHAIFGFYLVVHKQQITIPFLISYYFFLKFSYVYFWLFYSSLSFTASGGKLCVNVIQRTLQICLLKLMIFSRNFGPSKYQFLSKMFLSKIMAKCELYNFVPICIKNVSGKNHS